MNKNTEEIIFPQEIETHNEQQQQLQNQRQQQHQQKYKQHRQQRQEHPSVNETIVANKGTDFDVYQLFKNHDFRYFNHNQVQLQSLEL